MVEDLAKAFPQSYLGSPWNCLDFIIVVTALLGYIPAVGGVGGSGIRLMRVLRPLRSVNRLPSLRVIIATMLDSFRGMLSVLVLVLFLFVVYGIIGVQFFNGALHNRCFPDGQLPGVPPPFTRDEDPYSLEGYCSTDPSLGYQCSAGFTCLARAEDPQWGWVSFDNIGLAFLTIYNVISMSNWVPLSYQLVDSSGSFSVVFFVTIILFGTFFSINIVLAVVVSSYEVNFAKQQAREQEIRSLALMSGREARQNRIIDVLRAARLRGLVHINSEEVLAQDMEAQGGTMAFSRSSEGDEDLPPPDDASRQVLPARVVESSAPSGTSVTMGAITSQPPRNSTCQSRSAQRDDGTTSGVPTHTISAAEVDAKAVASTVGAADDGATPRDESALSSATALFSSMADASSPPGDAGGVILGKHCATSLPPLQERVRVGAGSATASTLAPARHGGAVSSAAAPAGDEHSLSRARAGLAGASASIAAEAAHLVFGAKLSPQVMTEAAEGELKGQSAQLQEDSDGDSDLSEDERELEHIVSNQEIIASKSSRFSPAVGDGGRGAANARVAVPAVMAPTVAAMRARKRRPAPAGGDSELESSSIQREKRQSLLIRERLQASSEVDRARHRRRVRQKQARTRRHWAAAARITIDAEALLRSQRAWLVGKPQFIHVLNKLVRTQVFNGIIVLAILINTVLLAMDYEGIPADIYSNLETANVVLTVVFTAEMVLKAAGLGPRVYLSDAFNAFDAVIVATSLVELAVAAASSGGNAGSIVGVFRTFRLLRVLKLAKSIKSLRILLVTTINSLPDIGWMSLLLVLFLFIFAVLGVQLFAGTLTSVPDPPPYNFDNLFNSMFAVLMVLTGDDWTSIMADTAYAAGGASIAYFVLLHAFGSYIVLSLFVAILLQRFSDQQDAAFDEEDYTDLAIQSLEAKLLARDPRGGMEPTSEDVKRAASARDANIELVDTVALVVMEMTARDLKRRRQARDKKDKHNNKDPGPRIVRKRVVDATPASAGAPATAVSAAGAASKVTPDRVTDVPAAASTSGADASGRLADAETVSPQGYPMHRHMLEDGQLMEETLHGLAGSVLGMCSATWPPRQLMFRVVTSAPFEGVVLLAILVNCVMLALETPFVAVGSTLDDVLRISDVVFAVLFSIEAICKIFALGIWRTGKHAYFRSSWNVLDFFIVVVSLLSLALPDVAALRSLRALRPLRVVVRSPQIQVVIRALVYAMPNILNVFMLTMLLWLIFAILGVNLFKGVFGACNDEGLARSACVGQFVDATATNATRAWETPFANFDNVGSAMLTLFQVATLSDWASIARSSIDATGRDTAPEVGTNQFALFYYFAFIIIGSFFSLNLFIGVVIDNFNRLKKELDGSAFMTKEQRQLANADKLIRTVKLETRPDPPSNLWRRTAFNIVLWPWFDSVIIGSIIVNALVMSMQFFGQPPEYALALEIINTTFLVIFLVEAALKITGLGWEVYFRSQWNRFDFFVCVAGVAGLFLNAGGGAGVIRVLRTARLIRIARVGMLRQLLTTLVNSLPSLWNIGGLLFVLFFIFATLGTNLFGKVPLEEVDSFGVSRQANFRDFGNSIYALWRIATGDAWENLLYSTVAFTPSVAVIYFVVFQVGVAFVMINLFIAVILENFEDSEAEEQGDSDLTAIHGWAAIWNKFDPLALKWVPVSLFPRLMATAPRPFGLGSSIMRPSSMLRRMATLRVPISTRPISLFAGKIGSRIVTEASRTSALGSDFSPVRADAVHAFEDLLGSRPSSSRQLTVAQRHSAPQPVQPAPSLRDSSRGLDARPTLSTKVWCVNLTTALKSLAAVVIRLDVKLEEDSGMKRRFFVHEWLLVRMIEEVAPSWLAKRRAAELKGGGAGSRRLMKPAASRVSMAHQMAAVPEPLPAHGGDREHDGDSHDRTSMDAKEDQVVSSHMDGKVYM